MLQHVSHKFCQMFQQDQAQTFLQLIGTFLSVTSMLTLTLTLAFCKQTYICFCLQPQTRTIYKLVSYMLTCWVKISWQSILYPSFTPVHIYQSHCCGDMWEGIQRYNDLSSGIHKYQHLVSIQQVELNISHRVWWWQVNEDNQSPQSREAPNLGS